MPDPSTRRDATDPGRRLKTRLRPYLPFVYWVVWFLVGWVTLVLAFDLARVVAEHWPIALAMLFGSYVAGSTPMGGGTIGFPILVLLFDRPAALGRTFSFAIQAVGMSSAALYILCSGQPLASRVLLWAAAGSTVALPIATVWLLPHCSDAFVKMLFATTWAVFGVHTLLRWRVLLESHRLKRPLPAQAERTAGLGVGIVGGVTAALTGVGVDMVIYLVLVLAFRTDVRVAVATSVVLMAYNSLLGVLTSAAMQTLTQELFEHWIAAAPIVLFGAPLGAVMVRVVPRHVTMLAVAVLCLLQFVWTCRNVGLL